MASFVNACVFTPASGGTGSFVVSSAVTGWMTPAQAGAVNGATYRYRAYSSDLTEWEIGTGTYTSSTTTLTRTVTASSNAGSAVNFTSAPQVALTLFGEDISSSVEITGGTISGLSSPIGLASGGTGSNLTDPNADRIVFWDDSASAVTWLEVGSGLSLSGTTLTAASSGRVRIVDFAGGIYTPASGTKAIYGVLTGGGGGGGSAAVQNSNANYISASGGNGGNTVIFTIDEADLYSSGTAKQFQVTIGFGGAATGTPTNTSNIDGYNGGDSSFTNFTGSTVNMQIVAKGGYGGKRGIVNLRATALEQPASTVTVNSGFTSLKTLLLNGGRGQMSRGSLGGTSPNNGVTLSSQGGDSYWGSGAIEAYSQSTISTTSASAVAGLAATDPGTGGGGGAIRKVGSSALAAAAGGAGAKGKCLILEFY